MWRGWWQGTREELFVSLDTACKWQCRLSASPLWFPGMDAGQLWKSRILLHHKCSSIVSSVWFYSTAVCVYSSHHVAKFKNQQTDILMGGGGFVPDSCTAAAKQSWVSVGDLTCTTIQLKQSLKRELLQTSGIPRWRLEDNKTQQLTTYHFCLLFFMYFGKKRVVSLTAIYVIILIALTASYLAITAFLILMRL